MEYKVFESMIHPIRMRIIQQVIRCGTLTVRDISESLKEIPPASLYRQINRLVADGLLKVVAENRVRGTLEKVYAMDFNPYQEIEKVANEGQGEPLFNLFYHFIMTLLSDFQSYTTQKELCPEKDGVGFRSYLLYQNDEEFGSMIRELGEVMSKYLSNEPAPDRKLRKLSTVLTPVSQDNE